MTDIDRMLVAWIRAKCAREFTRLNHQLEGRLKMEASPAVERDYPFFYADGKRGESADETILRIFRQVQADERARRSAVTDDEVVEIMIHG